MKRPSIKEMIEVVTDCDDVEFLFPKDRECPVPITNETVKIVRVEVYLEPREETKKCGVRYVK